MRNKITKFFLIFLFFGAVAWAFLFFVPKPAKEEISQTESSSSEGEDNSEAGHEQKEASQEREDFYSETIPAMAEKVFLGDDLEKGRILEENSSYTRYYITYKSEGFKISGIMNVPKGGGKFPALVLNHGYIDPEIYQNGQGLKREQDYLARKGYVVIHSDYRNHAESDFDPQNDVRPRSGYVEDIMNLLSAVQKSEYEFLDKENVGMLGHSMGGGVTINVMTIAPEDVGAYVLLAPINSNYKENFERWVAPEWPELAREVFEKYGSFEESPKFWEGISASNYLDRIQSPVMLHQGTKDPDVPVAWSRELAAALEQEGKHIEYFEYPGEGHLFLNNFEMMMGRSVEFFDKYLKR